MSSAATPTRPAGADRAGSRLFGAVGAIAVVLGVVRAIELAWTSDDAYISFRRAISVAPNDVRAWKGMATTAEALGFDAEAEKAYARWAELEKAQGLTGNTE